MVKFGLHVVVMIANIHLSQEIFAIDMVRALKFSLKHCRKHVLRPLQLYGDQAQVSIEFPDWVQVKEKTL